MFGKLDNTQIEQLLYSQLVGRIGCHANDMTYVLPVSYAYDGISVYVHTYEGMKMDMMRKNPTVCFQADKIEDYANWQSVVCWGTFEELVSETDRMKACEILNGRKLPVLTSDTMHLTTMWPFSAEKEEKPDGVFFRISLNKKTGRYEKIASQDFFAT